MSESKSFHPEAESTHVESLAATESNVDQMLGAIRNYAEVDLIVNGKTKNYASEMVELMQMAAGKEHSAKDPIPTDPEKMRQLTRDFLKSASKGDFLDVATNMYVERLKHRGLGQTGRNVVHGETRTITEKNMRFIDDSDRGRFRNARDLLRLAYTEVALKQAGLEDVLEVPLTQAQINAKERYVAVRREIDADEYTPRWIKLKATLPEVEQPTKEVVAEDAKELTFDAVQTAEDGNKFAQQLMAHGEIKTKQQDPRGPEHGMVATISYKDHDYEVIMGPGYGNDRSIVVTEKDRKGSPKRHFTFDRRNPDKKIK